MSTNHPENSTGQAQAGSPLVVDFSAAANSPSIIKVIGVGGGGDNAVGYMYTRNIHNVSFLVSNTDSKALRDSPVPDQLQLGTGLGAGGKPEIGRRYALESLDKIRASLDDGTKMVFITAGMGGGTGTGAAPVIAHEAKEKGILTIGIVTIPFLFEGNVRIDKALEGVEAMSKEVDALLIVNNERLRYVYHNLSLVNAFTKADDTLCKAVNSIVDIITMRGKMILDFRDVDTTLRNGGVAIMSTGIGTGERRVTKAIEDALNSPLLNDNDVYNSRNMLLSIWHSGNDDTDLMMSEMDEIDEFMSRFNKNVETKFGLSTDPELGESVRITILASGFKVQKSYGGKPASPEKAGDEEQAERAVRDSLIERIYGESRRGSRHKHYHCCLLDLDNLDNEQLIYDLGNLPTARRKAGELERLKAKFVRNAAPALHAGSEADGPVTILFNSEPS